MVDYPILNEIPRPSESLSSCQLFPADQGSGFGSLEALLARLRPILRLILQIPPVEPWSSIRISYLLAFTGSMINYITSLPLIPTRDTSDDESEAQSHAQAAGQEEQAGQVMRDTIDFLNEVDRAWRTVLKGNAWVMGSEPGSSGKAVRVSYAGTVGQTERYVLHHQQRPCE